MAWNKDVFILSEEEMMIVGDTSWIMTKLRIIAKVYALYGRLSEEYAGIISKHPAVVDEEVAAVSAKIYKGESYRQLPYVMMDLPRFFKQDDVFAIRSFFWWGNSFSIQLLLGGKYKERFESTLLESMRQGSLSGWYAGVGEDPWQHHFEPDNYRLIKSNAEPALLPLFTAGNYLKLAKVHSFDEWDHAEEFYTNAFEYLIKILDITAKSVPGQGAPIPG